MAIRSATSVIGLLGVSLGLVGCAPGFMHRTETGAPATFMGSTIRSSATVDLGGRVQSVSVTIPYAALGGSDIVGHNHSAPVFTVLQFPEVVRQQTFLNHFQMDWMPMGHEPERYMTPHFDFHFYAVSPGAVAAVDCKNARQPDPATVPTGWLPPVPPGVPDPTALCVPNMGYHAVPLTEFSGPGTFKSGVFDRVMIVGFYDGQLTFIEPMVTLAALREKKSFSLPVPLPVRVSRTTLAPTTFNATYDARADAYVLTLSGFQTVQGSGG